MNIHTMVLTMMMHSQERRRISA